MKKLIAILFLSLTCLSCNKDEDDIPNSIAEDLQEVIENNGVHALQYCCVGCSCGQPHGWGADYSFPGDNFVRIRDENYNLLRLVQYDVQTVTMNNVSEKRLFLYFP
ncbi:MAG TPA: hypothetical protein VJ894_06285 [Cryomorphaceae bacterium]|nr:hypothetical protein [Cryomorphaceae bacterium]